MLQNPGRYTYVLGLCAVRCRATSYGGVGYEQGCFKEESRKLCEYECTRLDTGVQKTIQACGKDSFEGDSCYGAILETEYNHYRSEFVKNLVGISSFNYQTNDWWDWFDKYVSDFEETMIQEFGPNE